MLKVQHIACMSLLFLASNCHKPQVVSDDLWLEEIESKKSLAWVKKISSQSEKTLMAHPEYDNVFKGSLELLNAKDRIAYGVMRNSHVYNYWKDQNNLRGIWRRCVYDAYKKNNISWETVLDVDQLATNENKNWVFKSPDVYDVDYSLCLLNLSDGGKDAVTVREFDLKTKTFVANGFNLKECKSNTTWLDKNNVIVGTSHTQEESTESGYPRQLRLWRRGQPLTESQVILEGKKTDVSVSSSVLGHGPDRSIIINRNMTFYTSERYVYENNTPIKLELPKDSSIQSLFQGQLIVLLKSPWKLNDTTYAQGSLISLDWQSLKKGKHQAQLMWNVNDSGSIQQVSSAKNSVLVNVLEDVKGTIYKYEYNNNAWTFHKIKLPKNGRIRLYSSSQTRSEIFITYTGFLTPSSFYNLDTDNEKLTLLKQQPANFEAKPFTVEQRFATSKDGTKIPYFVVRRKDLIYNGSHPTLLYGYGGFQISMLPHYSSLNGKYWLEKGGVYVLANIRGGGEYGPRWHQAALKKNRQRAYDDFIAVAEDLIHHKITCSNKLGIEGGSNGGLLMGAMLTQRPELFQAVVCSVPLLDMLRYPLLLAGASWVAEYGDPKEKDMAKYLKSYSPYHQVKPKISYPEVFFITSTKDDRVHPGHARRMAHKMMEQGHKIYYYENTEGGHGAASNNKQVAHKVALRNVYLYKMLMNE